MRSATGLSLLALFLTACAEPKPLPPPAFAIDGIPVYGRAYDLPKSEIRAAIAEDRRWAHKIYSIEVASATELHIYHTTRNTRLQKYTVYTRVHRKWQSGERVLGGSELLVPTS